MNASTGRPESRPVGPDLVGSSRYVDLKTGTSLKFLGEHQRRVVVQANSFAGRYRLVLLHDTSAVGKVAATNVDTLSRSVVGIQSDAQANDGGAGVLGRRLRGVQ